jgi:hypothetical protein
LWNPATFRGLSPLFGKSKKSIVSVLIANNMEKKSLGAGIF